MSVKNCGTGLGRPDTGLLYSVDDIAAMARVSKVCVVKLCLDGQMPDWLEVDGRRYWDRAGAVEAVAQAVRMAAAGRDTARKIA